MKCTLPNPCLLEAGQLPMLELTGFAVREGRRPRPIYTGHKWFARRLGSVVRALLVGATSPPGTDFWDQYYGSADLRELVVLDPFVGGGTSTVEALRLGATVHALDVDPVACAVSRFEMNAAAMPDLSDALQELTETVGSRIRRFHLTQALDGTEHVVLHHFWVQVVDCDNCGGTFDAHPNFLLGEHGPYRWVICSHCGDVHRRRREQNRLQCSTCEGWTRISEGNVSYGTARCPHCGERRPLIDVGRGSGTTPVWRLFAMEVLAEPDGGRPVPIEKRHFVKAEKMDLNLFEAASERLRARVVEQPEFLPQAARINHDRTDSRLLDYGYRCWTDLFNPRQLLHLSLLTEAISKYDDRVREALSIAFSSHLTTNCMLAGYAAGWRRLTPLFGVRAFRHIQRPVEINPWCDGTGRGTFPNAIRKLSRASSFACDPKEPTVGGGFRPVPRREPAKEPCVVCGTARDLTFLTDETVDLVLTDPPYLDNIAYSELAEFFLPWLELLKVVDDPGSRPRVLAESLVGQRDKQASIDGFTERLGDAFAEVGRVLKVGGLLVFSFRHTSVGAWTALANGLERSDLRVVKVLPVPGEAGIGLHIHEGTGLWDAVFVMRKTSESFPKRSLEVSLEQIAKVRESVVGWDQDLNDASIAFSEADKLTLLRAGIIESALAGGASVASSTRVPLESALTASCWRTDK